MKELLGALVYNLLDTAIRKIDLEAWIRTYVKRLVQRLADRLKEFDVDEKLQSEVLDPIKELLEDKWNVNL